MRRACPCDSSSCSGAAAFGPIPSRAFADQPHGEGQREGPRPSILLIMPDQMRGQDMGCMGNPEVRTPNLDRLASQGLLFRNTFANTPVCCPARAILLTGKYAHTNGMVANDLRLRESETTLAEILADAGLPHRLHRQVAPRRRQAAARLRPARPQAAGLRVLGRQRVRPPPLPARPTSGTPTGPITEERFEPEVWTDRAIEFLQAGRRRAVLPGGRHGAAARPLWRTREVHEALRPGEADDAAQLGRGRPGRGPQGDRRLLCGDHRRR